MRVNAHDSSLCGGRLGGFRACGHGQRALRSPFGNLRPPTLPTMWRPMLAGRGGSVSRRDHNQAYRRSTQLTGGTNYAEATNLNASRSSGGSAREGLLSEKPPPSHYSIPIALRERGSGGEALLSEKRPLPQNLPTAVFPGGSAREGAFLQKGPLPRIRSLSHNFFEKGLALFGKMGYNKNVSFANVRVLR